MTDGEQNISVYLYVKSIPTEQIESHVEETEAQDRNIQESLVEHNGVMSRIVEQRQTAEHRVERRIKVILGEPDIGRHLRNIFTERRGKVAVVCMSMFPLEHVR